MRILQNTKRKGEKNNKQTQNRQKNTKKYEKQWGESKEKQTRPTATKARGQQEGETIRRRERDEEAKKGEREAAGTLHSTMHSWKAK